MPELPTISVLIAARNEAQTLTACLRAVAALDYPADRLEVWIGNDGSTDETAAIASAFIENYSNFQLINSEEQTGPLRGKANVLAQLARHATGDYLFFTDADTEVPPTWINGLLQQPADVLTGLTLPDGPRLFDKLQALDWLYALTLTYIAGRAGVSLTAMGNNMAVRRSAYLAVGGYESLPFSVVEDYALFRAVVEQGGAFAQQLDWSVLARTRPAASLTDWLQQRKRWMRGAFSLPVWVVLPLLIQYLTLPLLLLGLGLAPWLTAGLYLLKILVQTGLIGWASRRIGQNHLVYFALWFEGYQLLLGPLAVAFYTLPIPMIWKGRQYL